MVHQADLPAGAPYDKVYCMNKHTVLLCRWKAVTERKDCDFKCIYVRVGSVDYIIYPAAHSEQKFATRVLANDHTTAYQAEV